MHRCHLDIYAGCAEDLARELIPGAESLVGRMVSAVFVGLDHIHKESCEIVSVGRGSDLIINDRCGSSLLSDPQHGLDKVLAVYAEYPGDADGKEFLYQLLDCKLSLIFGLSIDIQWMSLVIRLPRACSLSVKHIVCADVHHLDAEFFADFRDISCPACVDLHANIHIVLRCVNRCISGTVDDRLDICLRDHTVACLFIGNIHLRKIDSDRSQTAFFHLIYNVMTKLAFYACY